MSGYIHTREGQTEPSGPELTRGQSPLTDPDRFTAGQQPNELSPGVQISVEPPEKPMPPESSAQSED